jgi:serine phosphatase RsbU (regulator of sigma subunit)
VIEVSEPAPASSAAVGTQPAPGRPSPTARALRQVRRLSVAALVVGLAATAVLSWACFVINQRNENRLLALQTKEVSAVLQVVIPVLQTPLSSAAEIAATSNGDPVGFRNYISSYVGAKGSFVSASLWRVDTTGAPQLIAVAGSEPELPNNRARADVFIRRAARRPAFDITGPVGADHSRLGFAFASVGHPTYVVYAESPLPADRRVHTGPGSTFADLHFALYLGRSTRPAALIETNVGQLPLGGHTATETVPFGTGVLTLVAGRAGQLGGALSGALWWLVAVAGVLISLAVALAAERLVRRRRDAERLSREVGRLLGEQRGIAEALQRALLPQRLPQVAGVQIAVRYIPGVSGVDIGGDWYDVIELDERRFFFVVGDVSGRGVAAGSTMAELHFAIRGFVSEGHPPATVLQRLSALLSVSRDRHFATVLCGVADLDRSEVTVASAGHLPLLLLHGADAAFVDGAVGPPIGVPAPEPYSASTVAIPPGSTLLAFTDGLVERRGETIDDGLRRLRSAALGSTGMPLEDQLSSIVAELGEAGLDDDTAILGVRWQK